MRKITLLVRHNPYDMYRYFTKLLKQALERKDFFVRVLDIDSPDFNPIQLNVAIDPKKTDLTISFASVFPTLGKQFIWESSGIPHLFILNDTVAPFKEMVTTKNLILAHVDRMELEVARAIGVKKAFFLPHAVDQELSYDPKSIRPYDVVFCAGSYDHETIRSEYLRFPKVIVEAIEESIEAACRSEKALFETVKGVVSKKGLNLTWDGLVRLYFTVDAFIRGKDRYELVRQIKEAKVLVIGGTVWDLYKTPLRGWSQLLQDMPNASFKPSVSYEEFLNLLKNAKIVLNSAPQFKYAAHERFLNALACGAVPVTTENGWVKEHFKDGEELIIYQPHQKAGINEKINVLLADENSRLEMVERGRLKVMREHTWDCRVLEINDQLQRL